jgi:hypothetical protein
MGKSAPLETVAGAATTAPKAASKAPPPSKGIYIINSSAGVYVGRETSLVASRNM